MNLPSACVRQIKPFFFWYGATEPHRGYEQDSWKRSGKNLEDAEVPATCICVSSRNRFNNQIIARLTAY